MERLLLELDARPSMPLITESMDEPAPKLPSGQKPISSGALVQVAAGRVLARKRKRHAVVEHEPALGRTGMEHDGLGATARGALSGGAAVRRARPRPGRRGQRRELALRLRRGGGADRGRG